MSLLRIDPHLVLLWATPEGESVPFEVSKEVSQPLQPRCATSPYCPDERSPRIRGELSASGEIASVVHYVPNPNFAGVTDCPYHFTNKEQCYRDLSQSLMRLALFSPQQATWIGNYLDSIGYEVERERIVEEDIREGRTLMAHGMTYNFHEVRYELGPGGVNLLMIRNPYDPHPRGGE